MMQISVPDGFTFLCELPPATEASGRRRRRVRVMCNACGNPYEQTLKAVQKNKTCGCGPKNRTHGESGSREYRAWVEMKRRCDNSNRANHKNYGGRGITYCDEWSDFETFLLDMGRCPGGWTLERIDTNAHYNKSNCTWKPAASQSMNRRTSRVWVVHGKAYFSATKAAIAHNVDRSTIAAWCNGKVRNGRLCAPLEGCYSVMRYPDESV